MPNQSRTKQWASGLTAVGIIVVVILAFNCGGGSDWETALKQGGDFSDDQWSASTCAEIWDLIEDGYAVAWWSERNEEIMVSRGDGPADGSGVPMLGTHLRHCRGEWQ